MKAISNKITLQGSSLIFAIGLINGLYKEPLYNYSKLLYWFADVTHFVVIPLILFFYLYNRFNVKPQSYGLIKPTRAYPLSEIIGASIFSAIILNLVDIATYEITYGLFTNYGYINPVFNYHSVIPTGILNIPVVFYLAISAAVTEEIIFRGIPYKFIFSNKNIQHKKHTYVLLSSVCFAAVHWENGYPDLISAFIFGLLAAWLYLNYKNLWPLIGAHFLIDFYTFW